MESEENDRKIEESIKTAVQAAIERHRKLGEDVVVWENGKPRKIPASEIEKTEDSSQISGT